jgi:hypothetical protein
MSEASAVRTNVDRLEAFHELLSAITRTHAIPEIWAHLSETIGRIIPA